MPLQSIDVLSTSYLTRNYQRIEQPTGLLPGMLPPVSTEFPGTETIEWGQEFRNRETTDYLPMEAEALFVGDRLRKMKTVKGVNMAMQKSIRAGDFAHDRSIGEVIFRDGNGVSPSNGLEARIDRYTTDMGARLENNMDWWYSQMIQGEIAYSNDNYDSFVYGLGRDPQLNYVATPFWDTSPRPDEDIQTIKQLVADLSFSNIRVALCAPNVASQIRGSAFFQNLFNLRNVNETNQVSFIDSSAPYARQGAVTFIGRTNGVEFWEVNRRLTMNGVSVPLIRDGHIEFLSDSQAMDLRRFYFPSYDLEIAGSSPINADVFMKSWYVKHPSQYRLMMQSRPLVLPFEPNATCSAQVLA